MNSKGQSAVEYLIITSFLLVITGIIFVYSLFIYTDSVNASTANNAVASIVNAVDQVYALGPGSAIFIEVDIPQNISDALIINLPQICNQPSPTQPCTKTALLLKLQTSSGKTDVSKSAKGVFEPTPVTLNALRQQGHYFIKAAWNSSGGAWQNRVTVCLHDGDGICQS